MEDLVKFSQNLRLTQRSWYGLGVWHPLYSEIQLEAEFSDISSDATGDHVSVYVVCHDDEDVEFIVRLPEGEITEICGPYVTKDFDRESLKTEDVREILQRLASDRDTIFAMARKASDPDCTEYDLNELRDKIGGKIVRKLPSRCPRCHRTFPGDEEIIFTVMIPVEFYMEGYSFRTLDGEMKKDLVEAVEKGEVTGKCPYCHHVLTAEEIDKEKEGWQYRWRYDPWS